MRRGEEKENNKAVLPFSNQRQLIVSLSIAGPSMGPQETTSLKRADRPLSFVPLWSQVHTSAFHEGTRASGFQARRPASDEGSCCYPGLSDRGLCLLLSLQTVPSAGVTTTEARLVGETTMTLWRGLPIHLDLSYLLLRLDRGRLDHPFLLSAIGYDSPLLANQITFFSVSIYLFVHWTATMMVSRSIQ